MLTGRESLIRLVGKRRRFLPNRESLLSSPPPPPLHPLKSCPDLISKAKDVEDGIDGEVVSGELLKIASVTCPVCDTCLARGTKRKLAQRTLLQLNFTPLPKVQVCPYESEPSIPNTDCSCSPEVSVVRNLVHGPHNLDEAEKSEGELAVSGGSAEGLIKSPTPPLLSSNAIYAGANVNLDVVSGTVLETFIVGRKFSEERELQSGTKVTLVREPDNAKDPNAVKVFSTNSGCSKVLGYLPRQLAQYVSPLLEKCCYNFEGGITSIPEHYLDVVPIQISCPEMLAYCEIEGGDAQEIKYLWRNALREADAAKNNPPSSTKYQQNFRVIVHEVLASSPHLFRDSEKLFIGPWFRMSKISYPEISNVQQAVDDLSASGYVIALEPSGVNTDDIVGVLRTLAVFELYEILHLLNKNCKRGLRKQDVISLLIASYEDGSSPLLPSMILEKVGLCIRISSKAESLFWRAERIFFLNGEQDLSSFLLVDLGIIKYPKYNCIITDQIFVDRVELLAYEEAIEVAQLIDEALEENDNEKVLRCISIADSQIDLPSSRVIGSLASSSAAFLLSFTASWIYSKVVLLGVSFLERERRYNYAINLLRRLLDCFTCDGRRGFWTLRLSVDLGHLGYLNESLSVAENGLLDPWIRAGSRMALQKRILRLAKPPRRWKVPPFSESINRKIKEVQVVGRPLNCEIGKKNRFYGEDGEQCGVEQLALQHYACEGRGWYGVHTESGIWLTIFGLLMWDVIFSDVPNVFCTRFQTAPLDLETSSFYPARKTLIETQLQRIHEGMAEEMLITSWESNFGTSCRGINWERHSLSDLRAAVSCVGGRCLASLCQNLCQDYRSWSSGMPDLLLWRFHGEYKGEAKLVEVKGPTDRLSEQQRAWLLLLMDMGFNVEVCKVSPPAKCS
ncbi:hypothetical protein CDL15_Pgr013153 [Punica granatum]|uniref:Fanconi-associated nuclease n=1 Tax=Punica granatum TaxID=22663 RepID=A0A218WFZ8_PUNGR|nr:hypothetical protein CDL15_Pgr013153 [Punica granatum]